MAHPRRGMDRCRLLGRLAHLLGELGKLLTKSDVRIRAVFPLPGARCLDRPPLTIASGNLGSTRLNNNRCQGDDCAYQGD